MQTTRGPISADHKVPGGKLLRVRLTLDETTSPPRIATLQIHGDFFMHPEDAIEDLEGRLIGVHCNADALRPHVQAFFDSDIQVLGADVEGIVYAIMKACGGD